MHRLLTRCFEEKKMIEIVYLSSDGTITQRRIWIVSIRNNILTGYCYLRKQTRTFRIDQILSARTVKAKRQSDVG
ncbi:WYL domain-containing protein [Pseudalkalibacillus decolorationis]|uniref:WYL domain-containing protein n=1 Tax=Pseudalkalibacillus decolorationis TaxID=163879 RepID=UPI003555D097